MLSRNPGTEKGKKFAEQPLFCFDNFYLISDLWNSSINSEKKQPYRLIDRMHSKVPSHLHRFGTGFHRRIADASITGSNWRHWQLKGLAQGQGHTGWRWRQPRGYRHSQARRHPLRGQTALQAFGKLGRRKASRQRPGSQRIGRPNEIHYWSLT